MTARFPLLLPAGPQSTSTYLARWFVLLPGGAPLATPGPGAVTRFAHSGGFVAGMALLRLVRTGPH